MNLVAYGTRPEWIKLQPLINILKENHHGVRVLFTGQQKDIGEFEYDIAIEIPEKTNNRLNDVITSIIERTGMEKILNVFDGVTHTIVQGDTASAFAVALSSFNRGIPVSHIEAGLRTYDNENPYPEEAYRQMISCIASYHYTPTRTDFDNLVRERKSNITITGNTIIDTLPKLSTREEDFILITMHRRENHEKMKEWFQEIEKLANHYPYEFVLPLHPNPKVRNASSVLKKVNVVKPMEHSELLHALAKSKMIITDSGGIQEEASFYGKKVLVCRKATERPSPNQILIREPEDLFSSFARMLNTPINNTVCPFGVGDSSERIYSMMKEYDILSFTNEEQLL
jgi:UDP-N-acetylglucosamine 2-epimerase (non-hydrolysing)